MTQINNFRNEKESGPWSNVPFQQMENKMQMNNIHMAPDISTSDKPYMLIPVREATQAVLNQYYQKPNEIKYTAAKPFIAV